MSMVISHCLPAVLHVSQNVLNQGVLQACTLRCSQYHHQGGSCTLLMASAGYQSNFVQCVLNVSMPACVLGRRGLWKVAAAVPWPAIAAMLLYLPGIILWAVFALPLQGRHLPFS